MTRTKYWTTPALCTLLAALVLGACGTEKIKGPDLAKDVKSEVLAPLGISGATVKCPTETEAKEGAKVNCTVADGKKNKGSVSGTFDGDGNFKQTSSDLKDIQIEAIESNAAKQAGQGIKFVTCAKNIKPKKGAVFTCFTSIPGSGLGQVIVRQTGQKASDLDVTVKRRKLTTRKINSIIRKTLQKRGINANVDCPSKVTSRKGSKFDCKVTNPANGKQITVEATQKDDAGNFSLKVK